MALGLVALALASMPVFAFVRRGQSTDADVARRGASVLLGYWVRDWLMWAIGPAERLAARTGVSPDVFNYLGVAFGAAAGWAFAIGELSAAGWFVLFGGLADIFDGRIARARGLAGPAAQDPCRAGRSARAASARRPPACTRHPPPPMRVAAGMDDLRRPTNRG